MTFIADLNQALALQKKIQCLYSRQEVEQAIERVAKEMNKDLANDVPVFLCVMNGAVIFMGQLATRLTIPMQINYIHATRYRGEIEGRDLQWRAEPTQCLKDRVVVVVEDILDTGLTLSAVTKYCYEKGAKKVYTAALVDKNRPREEGGVARCDYTGLDVPDRFLVGYGLDYKDYLRNLDGIYAVSE